MDKVLKGTTPTKIPVEQARNFELVIESENRQADRSNDSTPCAGAGGPGDSVKKL